MFPYALSSSTAGQLIFTGFVVNFIVVSKAHDLCCSGIGNVLSNNVTVDGACGDSGKVSFTCMPKSILIQKLQSNYTIFEALSNDTLYFEDGSKFMPIEKYCLGELPPGEGNRSSHVVLLICRAVSNIGFLSTEICRDVKCRIGLYILETLKTISMIMLLVTASIYMVLRKLRDLQGSCILNFLICYIVVYTILHDVLHVDQTSKFDVLCPSIGYIFYFFALSSFGWLCISVFNAWKNLLLWNTHYMKTYILYLILIYGSSGLCLSVLVMIQNYGNDDLKPNFFRQSDCWFASVNQEWMWFYLPIEICLVVAALLLFDCGRRAWRICVNPVDIAPEMLALFKNCSVCFKLYLVISSSWIVAILLANFGSSPGNLLQFYISIQGILVFIVLIITEKKTMTALSDSEHYGCNLFPTTWTPVSKKSTTHSRYYSQNDDLTDVDLTLPSGRKAAGRRHTSLGA